MNKIILAALISIITLISVRLSAQGFGKRDGDRFNVRERIHEQLNLTEEQESKIEELRFSHESTMIDLKAELEKKELALQELKSKNNYTRDEFLALTDEIIKVKNKIELARAIHQMDVYEILDLDQREKWNKFSHRMHEMKKDFRFKHKAPRFE